jgi:hypothetical protein
MTGFTSDGVFPTYSSMEEVFDFSWGNDMRSVERLKGEGTIGINTDGAMNAVYGPYVQNLAYNKAYALTAIGQQPYRTAYRFQESMSMTKSQTSGLARGAGVPNPVVGNYLQFEQPYKLFAHRFAMNLGMVEIGSKQIDDVMLWETQVKNEADTFLWTINNDLLRRVEDPTPTGANPYGATEYVGAESLDRIISNYTEGQYVPAGYNVPWKMYTQLPSTDSAQPLAKYRNPAASGAVADNNINCYVDANYTAGTTTGDATLRQLTLSMIDTTINTLNPYWDNYSSKGKVIITGPDTMTKLQMILQPQQRYQGQVSAQFDQNGVKTLEGRETGFQVAKYQNMIIIPDREVGKGYGPTTGGHADDGISRMYFADSENLFMGVLRAPNVLMSDNPLITQRYTRLCDMNQFGEVQYKGMFKGLGKIVHLK